MKKLLVLSIASLAIFAIGAQAQATDTRTANITVTVANEAQLTAATNCALSHVGTTFADFTGSCTLTYKVRTTLAGGTGSITQLVTTDFAAGGPSVASPIAGDELTYTVAVAGVGTAVAGIQTASTTSAQPMVTFATDNRSTKAGDTATLNWTLPDDPQYQTGSYTAVVTYTISAS